MEVEALPLSGLLFPHCISATARRKLQVMHYFNRVAIENMWRLLVLSGTNRKTT